MIQPILFPYDNESDQIYASIQKMSKKVHNIWINPDKGMIDVEKYPYKGMKGRAIAKISKDIHKKNLTVVEKINIKYQGTSEYTHARMTPENTRNGTEVVIEIMPKFYSALDLGKAI